LENNILLGFSSLDVSISITSMLAGFFGAMADYILKRDDFNNLPTKEPNPMSPNRWLPLMLGRAIIGIFAGFTIWLVMIGSMVEGKEAIAKLWLLAGATGFMAPSMALKYNKKLNKYIEDEVIETS